MRKRVNVVPDSEEEYDDEEYEKKNEKTTTKNQEDDDETQKMKITGKNNAIYYNDLYIRIFIFLLALITYIPTFDAEFVWDDRAAILGNQDVVGNTPVEDLFKHDFWGGNIASKMSHKSYRPFCVLTFRLNYLWYNLEPGGYHLWNAVLHSYTCVMFYVFTRTFYKQVPAILSALLFAVHPVHTEAVAGIVGRADIVACFFMIISILLYAKAAPVINRKKDDAAAADSENITSESVFYLILAIISTIVAALFKEIGATSFCLMVAYEVFFIIRPYPSFSVPSKNSIIRIIAVCMATFLFLKARLSLHENHELRPWGIMENHIPLSNSSLTRTLTTIKSHGRYMRLLIWPSNLCYDHGFSATPWVESISNPAWVEGIFAYILVIICGMYALYSENRILQFSIAMLIVPFLPAANVFFYVGTVLAERLLYIPSMGYCIYAGYILYLPLMSNGDQTCENIVNEGKTSEKNCLTRFFVQMSKSNGNNNNNNKRRNLFKYGYMALLILGYTSMSYHTYIRNFDWKDEASIYEAGYREEPDSVKVLNNLAQVLLRDGNVTNARRAQQLLERSLELDPNYPSGWYNRGLAFSTLKEHEKAIELFKKAISLGLDADANCYAYMAQEYMHLYYRKKEHGMPGDESLLFKVQEAVNEAIDRQCKIPLVHFTAANLFAEVGQHENSLKFYEDALQANNAKYIEPGTQLRESDVRNQYALALGKLKYVDRALEQWDKAKLVNPDMLECDINAAVLLSEVDRHKEALEKLKSIVQQKADHPVLWNNMASIEEKLGLYEDSLKHFEIAYELMPTHQTIQNNVNRMRQIVQNQRI